MSPRHGNYLASSIIMLACALLALSGVFLPDTTVLGCPLWPLSLVLFVAWAVAFGRR